MYLPITRSSEDLPQPEGPEMRQPCPLHIWGGGGEGAGAHEKN